LAKAAATAATENEKPKDYLTRRRNGCTGWSATQQQHSETYKANEDFCPWKLAGETVAGVQLNNNTASTTRNKRRFQTSNLSNFRNKHTKTRNNSRRNGETVAGVKLDNNTASTKQSER
jgi:hypothetical protein